MINYNLKHLFRSCSQNSIYTLMDIFSFTGVFIGFFFFTDSFFTSGLFTHLIQSITLLQTLFFLPDLSEV